MIEIIKSKAQINDIETKRETKGSINPKGQKLVLLKINKIDKLLAKLTK